MAKRLIFFVTCDAVNNFTVKDVLDSVWPKCSEAPLPYVDKLMLGPVSRVINL